MELTDITHGTKLAFGKNSLDFTHSQNEIQPRRTQSKQGKRREVSDEKPREERGLRGKQAGEKRSGGV